MGAKGLLAVAAVCATCAAMAERQPFERYQSIIDRQMFGVPPKGFDPTKSPNEVQRTSAAEERQLTEEQQKLQSSVHFSVLNVTAGGETEVGFTDNADPKAPKHYYLKVGQSQDGWEVKAADPEKATMTLVKGDVELEMTLGDNTSGGGKGGGGGRAPAAGVGRANASPLLGSAQSLRSRRLQRRQREEDERKAQEEKEAEREQARKAEAAAERAQRDAEREEQRKQLLAIQEELKKSREAAAAAAKKKDGDGEEGGDDN